MSKARLTALEDVAALATVGATYPELMLYLQAEIAKCEKLAEQPAQQERPSFSDWTSEYVRDNLHRLKPAQPEQEPSQFGSPKMQALILANLAQPAKPQQEPVAWIRWEWNRSGLRSLTFSKPDEMPLAEEATGVVYDPLYTSPPAQQEPVAGKGKELSEQLKLCARNVAFVASGRVDMSSAAMQEMFALIDHVCVGIDSPPAQRTWVGSGDLEDSNAYLTPPQRTWVGLTDEEKSDIWCVVTNRDFVTEDTHVYADAIEVKLKEKNA